MKKKTVTLFAVNCILIIMILITITGITVNSSYAVELSDSVMISMKLNNNRFDCNGQLYDSPKPIIIGDTLHLPFISIAEAFGAQIKSNSLSKGHEELLTGTFMENQFEFNIAKEGFVLNGETIPTSEKQYLCYEQDTLYIPAQIFDACMGTKTTFTSDTGSISIYLVHDGNIQDLSGLLDEIQENKVGNSYFRWHMAIPRKSVLVDSSFNGNQVSIFNELKGILIEISVTKNEVRKLDYFLDNIDELGDEYILDASIKGTKSNRYIEAIFSDGYISGMKRVYLKGKTLYCVSASSFQYEDYQEADDDALFEPENDFTKLLDTFKANAFDADGQTLDLSKVRDNQLRYENYVNIPESNKILVPWSIMIPADWEESSVTVDDDIVTEFNEGKNENLYVVLLKPNDYENQKDYFKNYKEIEADFYNPELYQFRSGKMFKYQGYDALDIVYSLKINGKTFIFMERSILVGDLLCFLSMKTTERLYKNELETYQRIFNSLEIQPEEMKGLETNLKKQAATRRKMRLSNEDAPVRVKNAEFGWSSMLPGYWAKETMMDYLEYYYNSKGSPTIYVESIDMAEEPDAADWGIEDYMDHYVSGNQWNISDEPEMTLETFGENQYSKIAFRFEVEYLDSPYSAAFYILQTEERQYIIRTMIAEIHESQKNLSDFELFLKEFSADE